MKSASVTSTSTECDLIVGPVLLCSVVVTASNSVDLVLTDGSGGNQILRLAPPVGGSVTWSPCVPVACAYGVSVSVATSEDEWYLHVVYI